MDTWYERLSTLDSLFLEIEDRSAHMHVGAVAIFEGPPPPYRDFLALIEARLEKVPRYRQRVMFVPLKQGRPVCPSARGKSSSPGRGAWREKRWTRTARPRSWSPGSSVGSSPSSTWCRWAGRRSRR